MDPSLFPVEAVLVYAHDNPHEIIDLLRQELADKGRISVISGLLERLNDSVKFEQHIRDLAHDYPTGSVQWAVTRAEGGVDPSKPPAQPAPPEVNAEFARNCPIVMKHIRGAMAGTAGHGKIHAIKELRSLGGMGLKEAKDAVELVEYWEKTGFQTQADRENLEREARIAVASIQESMAALHAGAASAGVTISNGTIS